VLTVHKDCIDLYQAIMQSGSAGTTNTQTSSNVFLRKRQRDETCEPDKYKNNPVFNIYSSGLAEEMRSTLVKSIHHAAANNPTDATKRILGDFGTLIELDKSIGRFFVMQMMVHAEDVATQVDKTRRAPKVKKDT